MPGGPTSTRTWPWPRPSPAGLYGIDHELELADPFGGNAYEAEDVARIPSTLVEALRSSS